MSINPYASPIAEESANNKRAGGGFIRHRVFTRRWFYFWGFTLNSCRAALRQQAEEFINTQVGAENVISIIEHATQPDVVVWYREV